MIFDVTVLLASLGLCWLSKLDSKAIVVSLMLFTAFCYTEFMVSYQGYSEYSDWLILMMVYIIYIPLMLMVLDLKKLSSFIIISISVLIAHYNYLMFIEYAAYEKIPAYELGVVDYLYTPFMQMMYILLLLAVCFSTGAWSKLQILYRGVKKACKDFINSRRENGRRYRILG